MYLQDDRSDLMLCQSLSSVTNWQSFAIFLLSLPYSLLFFSGIKMNYGLIFWGVYSWITVASSTRDRSTVQLPVATGSWTGDRGQQGTYRQFN